MQSIRVTRLLGGLVLFFAGLLIGGFPASAGDQTPSGTEAEMTTPATLDEKNSLRIADQMIGSAIHLLQNDDESNAADDVAADLNKCMNSNGSMQQYSCLEDAYKKYDKILNSIYTHALSISDENVKNKIKDSQRKWIQFRDADEQASSAYWNNGNHGTIMGIVAGYNKIYKIRERILELMLYTGDEEG